MDKREAEQVANEVASRYRSRPRDELLRYLKEQDVFEVVAPSGTRYQIEVQAFWDDGKGKDLRVRIAVDDFGTSAFQPPTCLRTLTGYEPLAPYSSVTAILLSACGSLLGMRACM